MTSEDKLRKAIALAEGDIMGFEIDSKPITFTCKIDEVLEKPALGVKPFELWIEQRQEDLWEAIKRAKHYPENLINEWSFLDEMRKEWAYRNE